MVKNFPYKKKVFANKIEEIEYEFGSVPDIELHAVINKLNTVPFISTLDSCYGHPGIGRECNHDTKFFIGVYPPNDIDKDKFDKFWESFFAIYAGKTMTPTGWIQFVMTVGLYNCYSPIRLLGSPQHDPSVDERGNEEKKYGLQIICYFVDRYLQINS